MKKLHPLLTVLFLISVGLSQNKVNVNNLVKYGDKYFSENDDVPYDGIVFDMSKETGNKTLQFVVVSGLKNGSYQEWYENGISKVKGKYLNNNPTGLWTYWYRNGQKYIEEKYKDSKLNGLKTLWYDNGQKESEINYKNGKEDGKWIEWYSNGQKNSEVTYKVGKKDGLSIEWYENGNKEIEGKYKNDKLFGTWSRWYENGKKHYEIVLNQSTTIRPNDVFGTFWTKLGESFKGNLYFKYQYWEDDPIKVTNVNGKNVDFDSKGRKKSEVVHINGLPDGLRTEWYENGNIKSQSIVKGVDTEGQYGQYKIEGIKTGYYENGVKFYETNFVGGLPSGSTKVWFESGKKQLIGYFKDGERDSTWIIWNENGSKRSESSYKNGKRL